MQFLRRSWEDDKVTLSKSLQRLVDDGERNDDPFSLMICARAAPFAAADLRSP